MSNTNCRADRPDEFHDGLQVKTRREIICLGQLIEESAANVESHGVAPLCNSTITTLVITTEFKRRWLKKDASQTCLSFFETSEYLRNFCNANDMKQLEYQSRQSCFRLFGTEVHCFGKRNILDSDLHLNEHISRHNRKRLIVSGLWSLEQLSALLMKGLALGCQIHLAVNGTFLLREEDPQQVKYLYPEWVKAGVSLMDFSTFMMPRSPDYYMLDDNGDVLRP